MAAGTRIPNYKVCLVGLPDVGKTSIFNSIRGKDFSSKPRAEIDNFLYEVEVEVEGLGQSKVNVWDTAGMDRYKSLTTSYFRSAHAIALVFSIGCTESFMTIPSIIKEIRSHDYAPNSIFFLVGNKYDLGRDVREVGEARISEFHDSYQDYFAGFNATSAKTGNGIQELFRGIALQLYRKKVNPIKKEKELDKIINKSERGNCPC